MQKTIILFIILLSMSLAFAQELYVLNSGSQTLSHIQIENLSVVNNFAQIGLYGNHLALYEKRLYVVNSGDNNVQIIGLDGVTQGFVNLENSSNPWHIKIHNGFAYVTGLFTGKLYRIDLEHTSNITELFIGTSPQGMLVYEDKMYVALTGVNYPIYGQGQVSIIDLNTFSIIETIDVETNPQELIVDDSGFVHIVCSGDYDEKMTKVVILDSERLETVKIIDFDWSFFTTIQLGADGLVYIGNAFGLGFAAYDPITFEIIYGYGNTVFSGGQNMLYDSEYIYVLEPDWWGNSLLNIYTHDHELYQKLNLGIGSVAMVLKEKPVSNSDIALPKDFEVLAYPNPFFSSVSFEIRGTNKEPHIEIFNVRGQKIATFKGLVWNGKDMNDRDMPAGIYFVRVSNEENMVVKRILRIKS